MFSLTPQGALECELHCRLCTTLMQGSWYFDSVQRSTIGHVCEEGTPRHAFRKGTKHQEQSSTDSCGDEPLAAAPMAAGG